MTWMRKVKAHCDMCRDDKGKTSQVPETRIQEQSERGVAREDFEVRILLVTVDVVLRAWGR